MPGNADAGAEAQAFVVCDLIARGRLRAKRGIAQRAGIDEEAALEAQFGRQRRRCRQFDRGAAETVAAQGVLIAVGQIARTDTGKFETAQRIAAEEEAFENFGRAVEAPNLAGFGRGAKDPLFQIRQRIILRAADAYAHPFARAAGPGDVGIQVRSKALGRVKLAVARVVIELLPKGRRRRRALLIENEQRRAVRHVADGIVMERVVKLLAQLRRKRIAQAENETGAGLVVGAQVFVVGLGMKEVDASREIAIEKIRLGEAGIDLPGTAGNGGAEAGILPAAHKVAFMDVEVAQWTVC